MNREPKWVEVLDDNGEVIETLDENCATGCGGWNGYCGGCDLCLLMQASYYGCKMRYKDANVQNS